MEWGDDSLRTKSLPFVTGLAIAGFVVGCGLDAWLQVLAGLSSLALPARLALIALATPLAMKRSQHHLRDGHSALDVRALKARQSKLWQRG